MGTMLSFARRSRPWLSGSTYESDSSAEDECPSQGAKGGAGLVRKSSRKGCRRKIRRIIDREGLEYQSSGKFNIRHRKTAKSMYAFDMYHVAIHMPLWGLAVTFTTVYVISFGFFAIFWYMLSNDCDIQLETYRQAFYLSLETQMTIGYGVPDPSFNNCAGAGYLLVAQTVVGLMLDATIIGIVFQHVSAAYTRAFTVIFSDTAVLQVIDGCVHLIFRVAEMHRHPLLQAVMQVYCLQHHKDARGGRRIEVTTVLLEEPDTDVHNGVLFLGLPATVVHKVDYRSPLAPDVPEGTTGYPSYEEVKKYLSDSPYLEILVLLSGTEDATASNIEARHSYTLDDMYWNRGFVSCVTIDRDGYHCVDFHAIHHTIPVECAESPLRHLHSRHGQFPARLERQMSDDEVSAG